MIHEINPFILPSPLHKIIHPLLEAQEVSLWVKRDDLIHPSVSGNKWRKLKYNIDRFRQSAKEKLLTLGGAYSNHIAATAAACKILEIPVLGIIRGDELHENSNPTLRQARKLGMAFEFVSRQEYRNYREKPEDLEKMFPECFIIPEGGANKEGICGVQDIPQEIKIPFDTIICPVGTGTTWTGLVTSYKEAKEVMGVQVLSDDRMPHRLELALNKSGVKVHRGKLITNYHGGGYAKCSQALLDFIRRIEQEISLQLDPIYTGKAFFAVWDMIASGQFRNKTLVFLHTGGLQGVEGYYEKYPHKKTI
jgi:1-aminocyclopropane-1-carboxylate deaminase